MSQQRRRTIPLGPVNFLSVLDGIEGGFAVFVGIVAGLYVQGFDRQLLIITAAIGLAVTAFNASAMRYSDEHYLDELDGHEKRHKGRAYLLPAVLEFITYTVVSGLALLPLLLITDTHIAVLATVASTILLLFSAGAYRGHVIGRHAVRDGIELAILGALIISVGAAAGWILASVVA